MRINIRKLVVICFTLIGSMAIGCETGQVEIEHEKGLICVPLEPKRIVTLEFSFADALINLNEKPIAMARDPLPVAILDQHLETVGSVGTRAKPDLESIAAANPDLIIADLNRHGAIYEQLNAIAPTILFNSLRGSESDILNQFLAISRVINKEAQAAELVESYQKDKLLLAQRLVGKPVSVLAGVAYNGGFSVHSNKSFVGSFLVDLGLENTVEPMLDATNFELSFEGLLSVNPSVLIIMQAEREKGSSTIDQWQAETIWKNLQAVSADRVFIVDRDTWSRARGLLALNQMLGDVSNIIDQLLDD